MKKILATILLLTCIAGAIAQPPAAKLRKAVTTTTVDTILVDLPSTTAISAKTDSILIAMQQQISTMQSDMQEGFQRSRKAIASSTNNGKFGSFVVASLRHSLPLMPFVAGVFIAFFWFRYSYRRKVMRQDLIIKYIDHSEAVPEWLQRSEGQSIITPKMNNEGDVKNTKNVNLFLVLSIILGVLTFIWSVVLVNVYGLYDIVTCACGVFAFGYATVWCFKNYLKRSE